MNSYPDYINFFTDVAKRLTLIGDESGKKNVLFCESPEEAELMLSTLKTKLVLPCLVVEFYDEDGINGTGRTNELKGAFAVLTQSEKKQKGHDHTQTAIYEIAKPAADQILAYMNHLSDRQVFRIDNKITTVSEKTPGNWLGPVHKDLYGWRYEFTWRIAGGPCYDKSLWL